MSDGARGVLLAGVGGQGVVLGGLVVAGALLEAGLDVKTSEVHGMAQRGGIVSSHVRFGADVASPLLPLGSADALLAFESAEALRWLPYLKPGGSLVASVDSIVPPLACTDRRTWTSRYPAAGLEVLRQCAADVRLVPAREIASDLGNAKAASSVLLGVLSLLLDVPAAAWKTAIRRSVPAKALEVNLACFRAGRALAPDGGPPPVPAPAARERRPPPQIEITAAWCKGCDVCVRFCPEHCLALDGAEKATVVDPEACTGCRLCELLCPDFAIAVQPRAEVPVGV